MLTSPTASPPAAFDAAAEGYDRDFTTTRLGRWLRAAVQRQLAAAFPPGSRVLELACGTGEDAVWLAARGVHVVATDASPAMVAAAAAKAAHHGLSHLITHHILPIESLAHPHSSTPSPLVATEGSPAGREGAGGEGHFTGAFSNFGGLNCVADLRPVARALAALIRPGGRLVFILMGPLCPWEIAWYLAHAQPRRALRRLQPGGAWAAVGGRPFRVHYPTPRAAARAFSPAFTLRAVRGVGFLLPPSYLGGLVDRHPALFARLARWEDRIAHLAPAAWLADHYLLDLTRTDMPASSSSHAANGPGAGSQAL